MAIDDSYQKKCALKRFRAVIRIIVHVTFLPNRYSQVNYSDPERSL